MKKSDVLPLNNVLHIVLLKVILQSPAEMQAEILCASCIPSTVLSTRCTSTAISRKKAVNCTVLAQVFPKQSSYSHLGEPSPRCILTPLILLGDVARTYNSTCHGRYSVKMLPE